MVWPLLLMVNAARNLSLTPRFSGVLCVNLATLNRFNGLSPGRPLLVSVSAAAAKPLKRVSPFPWAADTPLKQGANEKNSLVAESDICVGVLAC